MISGVGSLIALASVSSVALGDGMGVEGLLKLGGVDMKCLEDLKRGGIQQARSIGNFVLQNI